MLLNYIAKCSLTTYKFIRIKKLDLFKLAVIGDSGALDNIYWKRKGKEGKVVWILVTVNLIKILCSNILR